MRDSKGRFIKGKGGFWLGKKRPEVKNWLTSFNKGDVPWNAGLTKDTDIRVEKYSKKTSIARKGKFKKDDNPNWRGDSVGYQGLHKWLVRNFGKAAKCEKCSSTDKPQWANKSGEYKRDFSDWLQLCYWCHRKYDHDLGWGKMKIRYG